MGPESEPVSETVHYANGNPKMKGAHLDGEMHGPWEWYRTDGSVMRTGQFDRGKQTGVWRTFDRAGRVVKETDFAPRRTRS
jgi:antitoxin component YwqK of YwqJK toxin-antitoxin module